MYNIDIFNSINNAHVDLVRNGIVAMNTDPDLMVKISIDSDGGDPDPAKEIYDMLENYRSRVTTIAGNKCMSSAVLIYLAGDIRIANEHTQFMIHPTSWTLWGMYSFLKSYSHHSPDLTLTLSEVYTIQGQLNRAAERLVQIEDYTDEIFKDRAKLTDKRFKERRSVNADQSITADESLKFGISTLIHKHKAN